MSRKNGCPFSIRDYVVEIQDLVTEEWIKVKGLTSMSVSRESETQEGKGGDALWAEPYITGRSLTISLEGRPIFDRTTGAKDPGQDRMDEASLLGGGCDNDQRVRISDAIGHSTLIDCIVTSKSNSADEEGETVSYELQGVGAPEELSYVQATAIQAKNGTTALSATAALTVTAGENATFTVVFTPTNASNQKFAVSIADKTIVRMVSMEDGKVTVQGIAAGETTVNLRSMNNSLTASFKVTVA